MIDKTMIINIFFIFDNVFEHESHELEIIEQFAIQIYNNYNISPTLGIIKE